MLNNNHTKNIEGNPIVDTLFAKLAEGGQVTTSLREMFFGTYGDLVDKYGFSWILQYGDGQKV